MRNIYLASSSPRRHELLKQIKLPHFVINEEIDESLSQQSVSPGVQVIELSCRKAKAAAERLAEGIIIAADTVVVLEGEVLGKPKDKTAALAMLERLQGVTHEVYTGLTVLELPKGRVLSDYECTEVSMRQANRVELIRYIETGEPLDKAGSYGIQGLASVYVSGIRGCYFNVVGLPIFKMALMLRELGIDVSEYWR